MRSIESMAAGPLFLMGKARFCLFFSIAAVLAAVLFSSCSEDGDDLNELFADKKFKITGCVYNGVNINGMEVKEFYSNPYYLELNAGGSFKCELVSGSLVTGTWRADGENRLMVLNVMNSDGTDKSVLSRQVFEVLRNVGSYSGDSNVMKLYKDKNNFLTLNSDFKWQN